MEKPTDSDGTARLCSRCKLRPARVNQYYCSMCHGLQMRKYRSRRKNEFGRLHKLIDQLTINNTDTRRKFEEKIGAGRRVIVTAKDNEPFRRFAGEVVGFLPGERLLVLDEGGKQISIPLAQVEEDEIYLYPPSVEYVASDSEIKGAEPVQDEVQSVQPGGNPEAKQRAELRGICTDEKSNVPEQREIGIGQNELSAMKVCHAYVQAQRAYALKDRSGRGVIQYAQKIRSLPGKKDGLYWEVPSGKEPSPLSLLVANAEDDGRHNKKATGQNAATPFRGYFFKILSGQGRSAPGGKYDYVIKRAMVAGFALIAYPAYWNSSGVMSFIVNQQDKIYQKNLGARTAKLVKRIQTYDPDPSWAPAE